MLRATFMVLVEFFKFFQNHVSANLISKQIKASGLQTSFLDWTNANRIIAI